MRAVADGRLEVGPRGPRAPGPLPRLPGLRDRPAPRGSSTARSSSRSRSRSSSSAPPRERTSLLQRLILHHLFPYAGRVKARARAGAAAAEARRSSTWPRRSGLTRLLPPTLRRMQAMLPDLTGRGGSTARGPAAGRPEAGAGRAVPRLRGRRHVPRDQRRDRARAPAERLRGRRPARPGLLRRDPLPLGRRGTGPRPGPAEPRGLRSRPSSTRSSSTPPAAARCSRTTPTSCRPPTTTPPARFVAKVKDISEFLVALGPIAPTHPLPLKVTYHDACHLCHGQQIRSQPRQLLGADPRPGARPARGERDLLRRGGDVQPDPARDVGAPRPPQDGPHRRHRGRGRRHRATSAASSRSPARSRSAAAR